MAVDQARSFEVDLLLLHVATYPSQYYGAGPDSPLAGSPVDDKEKDLMKKSATDQMEKIVQTAGKSGVACRFEVIETESNVVDEILVYAFRNRIDLLVVGTRGLNQFQTSLVGSTSLDLVQKAKCAVLIVR